jgi:pimeloyl-ACP methyl ester carboxylesterase
VKQAAVVVGISLGGLVAMTLALKHPEAVAAILPCDFYPKSPPVGQCVYIEGSVPLSIYEML